MKPEDQKALYDKVIKKRPSTILCLEHEVYGMFLFAFILPRQLSKCLLCLFQIPACNFFSVFFLSLLFDAILFYSFIDMKSFHMRSKNFKKQVTIWLRLLNVLDNNLIIVKVLPPHEMYVFCLLSFNGVFFELFGY